MPGILLEERLAILDDEKRGAAMFGGIFRGSRTAAGSRAAAVAGREREKEKSETRCDFIPLHLACLRPAGQKFLLRIIRRLIYAAAALIAYYLDNFSPFMVKFGPNFGIRWYGFSYLLGFFLRLSSFTLAGATSLLRSVRGQGRRLHSRRRVRRGRRRPARLTCSSIVHGNFWSTRFLSFASGTAGCRVTAE